jgi:copper chaperone CopZ
MTNTTLSAPDIECGGCAGAIEKALAKVDGIHQTTVDIAAKTVTVSHDTALVSVEAIQTRLDHVGFPSTLASKS